MPPISPMIASPLSMPLLFDHGEAPEIRLSQYFLQRSPFPALRPSTGPILERIEEGEEEYTELSNSIDTALDEPKEENRDDDIFSELGEETTDKRSRPFQLKLLQQSPTRRYLVVLRDVDVDVADVPRGGDPNCRS